MSDTEQQTPEAGTPPVASTPDTSQGTANNEGATEATFTQAELDRIVGERAKRASEAAISKLLQSLGVENVEQAQSTFEDAKKRREAEMSELEKAQAQIEAAQKQAKEALEAKQSLEQTIIANGRKQAFLKAVADGGGSNADDLFILVNAKRANDFTAVFDEDTSPNEAKMKQFIKQVQNDFPTYFGTSGAGSPSNNNGVARSSADFSEEAMATWRTRLRS